MTVLCASALIVLGVFYADGWIEFRKPRQQSDDSQSADKAKPAELQIRAVPVAEQFVEMLGDEPITFAVEDLDLVEMTHDNKSINQSDSMPGKFRATVLARMPDSR